MFPRITIPRLALLLVLSGAALLAGSAQAEEPLRNQDVVKMVSAGLGEAVVVAKVREAPQVAFQLAVDDLVALRQAGVGEAVVQAMLERGRAKAPSPSVPANPGSFERRPPPPGEAAVSLKSADGTVALSFVRGEVSSAGLGPFTNVFLNFPGTRAEVRTRERRPILIVTGAAPEVGRYFFAKLNSDRRNEVRSLKIGQAIRRTRDPGGRFAPDKDWVIPCEIKEDGPGRWLVTSSGDLAPGEYGWYVNLETDVVKGINPQGGCVFDFGVD